MYAAVEGDRYSVGYSAALLAPGLLDANYWRFPARGQPVQPSACADARLGQPKRARVAVPRCCTGRPTPAGHGQEGVDIGLESGGSAPPLAQTLLGVSRHPRRW